MELRESHRTSVGRGTMSERYRVPQYVSANVEELSSSKRYEKLATNRNWLYQTANVRTNHVHTVVTAPTAKPETVRAALKANATRKLREAGCWLSGKSPWAGKGSVKSLWTEKALHAAIAYVDEEQGEPLA